MATAGAYSNAMTVLLNNGNGTFGVGTSYATGNAQSVAVGDFNSDGKPDLVVTNANTGSVSVFTNGGNGNFGVGVTYAIGGTNPVGVAVGDFNSDGKPDLATVNLNSVSFSVLLNQVTNVLYTSASGNIGIGTTNTTAKLTVGGNILISGLTSDVVKSTNGVGASTDYDSIGATLSQTGTTAVSNTLQLSTYVPVAGTMSTTTVGTTVAVGAGGQVIMRSDNETIVIAGAGSAYGSIWNGSVGSSLMTVATGTTLPGAGAIALKRVDGRYLLIHGNNSWYSSVFDPFNQTAVIAGPPICGSIPMGAGTNAVRDPDGRYMITCGGSSRWGLYDSSVGVSGTYIAGADVGTSFGAGSQALMRDDGNFLVMQGAGGSAAYFFTPSQLTAGTMQLNIGGTGPVLTAGAVTVRMQNGKFLVLDGGVTSSYIYDEDITQYGSFTRQTGAGFGPSEVLGDGAQALWRPDGKYLVIMGGGSTTTNLMDISVAVGQTMFSAGPTLPVGVQQGDTAILNNDGNYYIVRGAGSTGVDKYDMNYKMTGSYTSEYINTSGHLNLTSTFSYNTNSAGVISFLARTGTVGTIGSASYIPIKNSGDLLGVGSSSSDTVQVMVNFTRSIPQFTEQDWGLRRASQVKYRRSDTDPAVYNFMVDNTESLHRSQFDFGDSTDDSGPMQVNLSNDKSANAGLSLVTAATYGNMSSTSFPNYMGSFAYHNSIGVASSQTTIVMRKPNGTFEVAVGTTLSPMSYVYDQNAQTFTVGTGLSLPTQNLGMGALAFKRPDGKFLIVIGGGTTGTNLYDPVLEKYTANPVVLTANAGAGAQAIPMPTGRVLIVLGNYTTATNIYDPFANTMTPGPPMPGNVGQGALTIPRPDGSYMVALGVNQSCAFNQATAIFNPYTMSTGATSIAISATAARGVGPGSMAIPRSDGTYLVVLGAGTSVTTIPTSGCAAQTVTSFYNPTTNQVSGGVNTLTAVGYGAHAVPRADGTWLIMVGGASAATNIYMEGVGATYNNFGVGGTIIPGPTAFAPINAGAISFQRDDGKFTTFMGSTQAVEVTDALWVSSGMYKSEIVNVPDLGSNSSLTWQASPGYSNITAEVKTAPSLNGIQNATTKLIPSPGTLINPGTSDKYIQITFNFKRTFPSYSGILTDVWSNSGGAMNGITKRTIATPLLTSYGVTKDTSLLNIQADGLSVFRVGSNGNVYTNANASVNAGGADLAERYISTQNLTAGEVVGIDDSNNNGVVRTKYQYQPDLVGVVSTDPGFVAGAYTTGSYPIALVGRVPVKVSTENGLIRVGDRLTSSSTPGYAMRATKAGRVIGKALETLDTTTLGDCPDSDYYVGAKKCGTMIMFVNLTDYLGMPVADLVADAGTTLDDGSTMVGLDDSDEKILQYLADNKNSTSSQQTSEIFTDKVVATKIVADTIVANKIQAKQIEGLNIFTDQITSLSKKYDDMKKSLDASSSAIIGVTPTGVGSSNSGLLGIFNFNGQTEFGGSVVVKALSEFWDKVLFKGEVAFEKTPVQSSNSAGFAVVNTGESQVDVVYDEEYKETPVVNATLLLEGDNDNQVLAENYVYSVTKRTTKGFTIVVNKNVDADVKFSWMAMDVKGAKTTKNEIKVSPLPSITPLIGLTASDSAIASDSAMESTMSATAVGQSATAN